jgi:hypothetical protein
MSTKKVNASYRIVDVQTKKLDYDSDKEKRPLCLIDLDAKCKTNHFSKYHDYVVLIS